MTLFIKKFNKYISKRRPFKEDKKEKTRSKRVYYNCRKNEYFIAQCPYERKDGDNNKKKKKDKSYKKDKKFTKKSLMDKLMSSKNGTHVMRVLSRKVMTWQP
jgi:hypothetical protein